MAVTQVNPEHIAVNAISGTIIADNAITSVHIAQNAILTQHIDDGQVGTAQLAADAVTSAKLADSSVVTANIQDDQVTAAKLAHNLALVGNVSTTGTLGVTGVATFATHVELGDSDILKLGASADLQIYHDSNHSYILDNGTGALKLKSDDIRLEDADGNNILKTNATTAELYHSGTKKLNTRSTGIDVDDQIHFPHSVIGDDLFDTDALGLACDHTESIRFGIENADGSFTERMRMSNDGNFRITGTHNDNGGGQIALFGTDSPAANKNLGSIHFGNSNDGNLAMIRAVSTAADAANLNFYTESAGSSLEERMRITSAGNVGLGTASPKALSGQTSLTINANVPRIDFKVGDAFKHHILAEAEYIAIAADADNNQSGSKIVFDVDGSTGMDINSGGNVKIYGSDLHFPNGLTGASVSGSDVRYNTSSGQVYYQTSSKRYKKDISDLEIDTTKIYELDTVSFTDKTTEDRCFGLIAEEVDKVIPELVNKRVIEEGKDPVPDNISYSMLSVLLLKELQSTKTRLDDALARIKTLEDA